MTNDNYHDWPVRLERGDTWTSEEVQVMFDELLAAENKLVDLGNSKALQTMMLAQLRAEVERSRAVVEAANRWATAQRKMNEHAALFEKFTGDTPPTEAEQSAYVESVRNICRDNRELSDAMEALKAAALAALEKQP